MTWPWNAAIVILALSLIVALLTGACIAQGMGTNAD